MKRRRTGAKVHSHFTPKNETLPSVVLNPPRYFFGNFGKESRTKMPKFEYEIRLRTDGGFEFTGKKSIKEGT